MVKRLVAAMLAAGIVVGGPAPAVIAQTPAQQHAISAPLRAQLRDEIARMTSLDPNRDRGARNEGGNPRCAR